MKGYVGANIAAYRGKYILFGSEAHKEEELPYKEYKVAEILIELSEVKKDNLIRLADQNPFKEKAITKKTASEFSKWLYGKCSQFHYAQATFLYIYIVNLFTDYFVSTKGYIEHLKNELQCHDDNFKPTMDCLFKSGINEVCRILSLTNDIIQDLIDDQPESRVLGLFTDLGFQQTKFTITRMDGKFMPLYSFQTIMSYVIFEVAAIIEQGIIIKKCENCGRFFLPKNRTDEKYCERISPQDLSMTCKEYGSKKLWYDKLRNDETKKLARGIYSAKQMLMTRHPDIVGYKQAFEKYRDELKVWKAEVKAGTKTDAEFLEWLKSVKEKKVL